MNMTSKQRVLSAIRHETPDRAPRFFWVGDGAAKRLQQAYGIAPDQVDAFLGNDVRQTWLSINRQMTVPCDDGRSFVDEWRITWRRDGQYNTVSHHPLADLDADAVAAHPLPDPDNPARYAQLRRLIAEHGQTHFIGADVSGTLFEPACHLRSMEELMIDLASDNDQANLLLDRLCEFSSAVAVRASDMGADWVWLGDDMGSQRDMLISPAMWRRHFKPRMAKVIAAARSKRPDLPIAYHSCGHIAPILAELVDLGIDVLNPLQESAGLSHEAAKREFGGRVTLMCGLDTQDFLPRATPEQTLAAMKEKARTLGEGGGYIAAVSHTLQHDVDPACIKALTDALA